ncbi:MAG: TonB-dependent receptor, partial [Chitinophagaceae bacterium]|nr:TonB-dependent receptor [Chitinophagaceae bacterium]
DILLVQGPGYFSLDQLLSPERYFPGGLSVMSYHVNNPGSRNVYANQLGNYVGSVNIGSAYIRAESRLTDRLFADIGIRLQSSNELVSNSQYNYIPGLRNPQLTTLDENINNVRFDLLPSINIRYVLARQLFAFASLFRSVNRPQMQQLTKYRDYDALSSLITTGNPVLNTSIIDNYETGIRWLTGSSHIDIGLSGFYKRITEPIENILSFYTPGSLLSTPNNTPTATVSGIHASAKFQVGPSLAEARHFRLTAFLNGVWIQSSVAEGQVKSTLTPVVSKHSLSGSPAYSFNAGLTLYKGRSTQLSIWYNETADYITAVGSGKKYTLPQNGATYTAIPDYRVRGKRFLDFQISQKLWERLGITAGADNILGAKNTMYQDLNGNKRFDQALVVGTSGGNNGFYVTGTDNTVLDIKIPVSGYLTLSYIFK